MVQNFSMEKINEKITDNILKAIEQLWGFQLPWDYREFILEKNGGIPSQKLFNFKNTEDGSRLAEFFGFIKNFNTNILLKQIYVGERIPDNMLPIANDVFGNLILLSVKGPDRGKIYFWDHEKEADPSQGEKPSYSNLTLIANNFEEFMGMLRSDEEEE